MDTHRQNTYTSNIISIYKEQILKYANNFVKIIKFIETFI